MPINAKKSLGQHFLNNPQICERIVNLLNPSPDDSILEIGPGRLALTKFLIKTPHSYLILLEKDSDLAREAQKFINEHISNFSGDTKRPAACIILMDALNFAWKNLNKSFKLIGNLPYNVASPLIWDIAKNSCYWNKGVFMVQKEVGERIVSKPDSKSYGALTVWVQNYTVPKKAFPVSPQSFTPPPKVDSMVLDFSPLDCSGHPENPVALKKLIEVCFQNRRKQLGVIFRRNNLPNLEKGLEKLNIPSNLRPENLNPAQYGELSRFWEN